MSRILTQYEDPGAVLEIRTLAERVHDLVRDRILSGGIAAGEPIRQDTLAAEFGISKIPLREALVRLEQGGLVRSQAHRGYVVAALSMTEAEEVFALRLQLEPAAIARGSRIADAAAHRAARTMLMSLDDSIHAGSEDQGRLNRLFHMLLMQPGAGPLTRSFLEQLHTLSERYTRLHLLQTGRESRACEEHREMLDLWIAGEADALEALTRKHILDTLADLRSELSEAGNPD
ncbi:GntR family transcriptional regulator [Acetobacteraceae bacterium KSS8]|uniref:GntR family transcriptional regulator n=1 Tax=Endosaccharibacter trunci TaxID=2812733 RepID=A0ABT1W6T7_9PROT|nr:GntR family transcriptional regulator [Acetobacteraceae bacterium KSS8]